MDAKQLQKESEKLHINAQSYRQQAEQLRQNANGSSDKGDEVTARIDGQKADTLMKEAERLERQADEADNQLRDNIREAEAIRRQEAELEANYKREMDQLERRKRQLLGESTFLL